MTSEVHSPLGLYFFLGGPFHSESSSYRSPEHDPIGAIQPDSSVTFGNPEAPVLYFNAKTRQLQLENTSEGIVHGCDETRGPTGWHVYASLNRTPHKLHCFIAETKLLAYLAAFDAMQRPVEGSDGAEVRSQVPQEV